MKKYIIVVLLGLMALSNSGCLATMKCVQKYNHDVDIKAMEIKLRSRNGDGEVVVGVDLLQAKGLAKGYKAAWKESPGSMTAAHGLDAIWMTLAGWGATEGYKALTEDDDDSKNKRYKYLVNLENSNGNSINIVIGDYNSSNNDDNITGDENTKEEK